MSQTSIVAAKQDVTEIADIVLEQAYNPPKSIEINNVTVNFKTPKGIYTAVKDIDLSVKKGEIVSLIGHSGCGKSTLRRRDRTARGCC